VISEAVEPRMPAPRGPFNTTEQRFKAQPPPEKADLYLDRIKRQLEEGIRKDQLKPTAAFMPGEPPLAD
jgi:hypothetical protein